MINLFFYELKKIFKTKGILISIVIIILCMLLNGINNAGLLNYLKPDVLTDATIQNVSKYNEKLFDELGETEYSDEKYEEMLLEYNSLYDGSETGIGAEKGKYGPTQAYDRYVYGLALDQMRYLKNFQSDISDVIINAEQSRENNKNLGKYRDDYKEKETTKAIQAYSEILNNTELKLCYVTSAYWYSFTESEGSNKFNTQLILFFICCIFSVYFATEYESRMSKMTYVTYKGRLSMFAVKNAVVFVISFLITLLSCLINIIVLTLHHGGMADALSQPVQLIFNNEPFAEFCPFNITFGQYMLLAFFMKFTAFYFASNIVVLMSVLFRKSLPSIAFSALSVIGILQLTLYAYQDNLGAYEIKSTSLYNVFQWLRTYSPISLLWSREYVSSFDVINLFGEPVYRLHFTLIFSWILILVLFVINSCLYCRRGEAHDIGIIGYFKKIWKKRSIA